MLHLKSDRLFLFKHKLKRLDQITFTTDSPYFNPLILIITYENQNYIPDWIERRFPKIFKGSKDLDK